MIVKKINLVTILISLIFYGSVYTAERSLLLSQLQNRPEYRPLYAAVLVLRERAQNPTVVQHIQCYQHRVVDRLLRIFATNDTASFCECELIRSNLPHQLTYTTYPIICNAVDYMCTQAQNGVLLRKAAKRGHGAVVKLLLGCGADVNKRSKRGETALMVASKGAHGVEKMLREAGAYE